MTRRPRPISNKRFVLVLISVFLLGMFGMWYCIRCVTGQSPTWLSLGTPNRPYTVLVMGADVPYTRVAPGRQHGNKTAFTGRSDTMMLVIVDPAHKSVRGVNIPRDTMTEIPGYGTQKINAANAIGGPVLAKDTVSQLLNLNVDHFVVVNVQGLVEAVDELGGITVDVPKRMSYMDWTAKLKIDLEPGVHTLTGNQAMGFVRYRHDDMGDIGRIQRQHVFMRAIIGKLMQPGTWPRLPKLISIVHRNVLTDLNDLQLLQAFNFARSIPRDNIQFAMLPGRFGPYGSWIPDEFETEKLVARMYGLPVQSQEREQLSVCLQNGSSFPGLVQRMADELRHLGYSVVIAPVRREQPVVTTKTKIIAQRGNHDEAQMVLHDLGNRGEIINASIGDIYSSITVVVGDDLEPLMRRSISTQETQQYH